MSKYHSSGNTLWLDNAGVINLHTYSIFFQAEKQRIENYEKFLKDHKTQKRKATWCDFPETQSVSSSSNKTSEPTKKKNKKKEPEESPPKPEEKFQHEVSTPQQSNNKSKKKKTKINNTSTAGSETQPNEFNENGHINKSIKEKKHKKNKQNNNMATNSIEQGNVETEAVVPHKNNKYKVSEDGKTNNNQQTKNKNYENQKTNNTPKQKKKKNLVNGEPARRKPVNDSFQLIINGKDIELVRYDGFPIMKKDAERLQELKTNMIKKGIPKSEVQRTMKLERRRAEKALARVKRDVCYNCRKGGHNLSDCPELKTKIPGVGAADGLCFKCGSTEHRQFECKVQKDKEFRFATCFICKEPVS